MAANSAVAPIELYPHAAIYPIVFSPTRGHISIGGDDYIAVCSPPTPITGAIQPFLELMSEFNVPVRVFINETLNNLRSIICTGIFNNNYFICQTLLFHQRIKCSGNQGLF